jgi:hypothetical protein
MSFKTKTALVAVVLLSSILTSGCALVNDLVTSADNWIKTHLW